MSHILHRLIDKPPPLAVGSSGMDMIGADGRRYLDASGGAAVSSVGHGHPAVVAALHAQLDRMPYAHTGFFTSEPTETLASRLVELAPEGIERVVVLSSGSEAVEAALKLARQYWAERGEPSRRQVIARGQSYHGATLGAMAAGLNAPRRAMFGSLTFEVNFIDPCFAYRYQLPGETVEDYARRSAEQLEDKILELGPENVSAFIAEPVVGTALGAVPSVEGYFRLVHAICRKYGLLLILDEVMCGMGRTGTMFASEQEGILPDIITIGKGLGGGYQPIAALLLSGDIAQTIASGSGSFQHNQTYLGHPMAAAAAVAVLDVIRDEGLLANVRAMGACLDRALRERLGDHPHVGDIRGRGLFQGIELVHDRADKSPFDPRLKIAARIKTESFERGLMVSGLGGTVDGVRGDHLLLAPPYVLEERHCNEIADGLLAAIDAAVQSARRSGLFSGRQT